LIQYDDENKIGETSLDNPLREHYGTIVSLTEQRIVCSSIGYVPEVIIEDANFLTNNSIFASSGLLDTDGQPHSLKRFKTIQDDALGYYKLTGQECFDIIPTYDGTNIRVWKHNGELLISTNGKINANKSRWGVETQTFGEMFYACAEDSDFYNSNLLASLDEGLIAYFVIMNKNLAHATKFPIGCDERDSVLVFTGYRNPDNTSPGPYKSWDSKLYPMSLTDFHNLPSNRIFIAKFLEDNEVPLHLTAGYNPENKPDISLFNSFGESITILYEVNGRRQQVKFSPPAYIKRFKLYNNQSNIFSETHEVFTFCMDDKNFNEYMERFPPVLDVTSLQYNDFEGPYFNEFNGYEPSYSVSQLQENLILRFRNAMSWYATSLPLAHQRYAIQYTNTLIAGRETLAKLLIANKDAIFSNTLEFPRGVKFPKEAYTYVSNGVVKIMNMKMSKSKKENLIHELAMKLKGNFVYQMLARYMYIEYGKNVKFFYNWLNDSRYNNYREVDKALPCNVKAFYKSLESGITPEPEVIPEPIFTPEITFDIKSANE
jgi:hypothetical protein